MYACSYVALVDTYIHTHTYECMSASVIYRHMCHYKLVGIHLNYEKCSWLSRWQRNLVKEEQYCWHTHTTYINNRHRTWRSNDDVWLIINKLCGGVCNHYRQLYDKEQRDDHHGFAYISPCMYTLHIYGNISHTTLISLVLIRILSVK